MGWGFPGIVGAAALLLISTSAHAQQQPTTAPSPVVQSAELARQQDAAAVAAHLALPEADAERLLRVQEASIPITQAIADRFAERLAGIALVSGPAPSIQVRLTGTDVVADELVEWAGEQFDVRYLVGALATRVQMVRAISEHQQAARDSLLVPPAFGVDQRSGELVAVVSRRDVAREGEDALRDRLALLTGVPVRLRVLDRSSLDLSGVSGGGRVTGTRPGDPQRYVCTIGFAVTDGERSGIVTAAHCPDDLVTRDEDGRLLTLPFVGQWGWGNQDVQVNAAERTSPHFFADTDKTVLRPVTGARSRSGTRAGDVVCHRGERTGYSCSVVELTDYAPGGDLCGGACLPTWTTVAGPACKSGDSGSPVFLGTTALGILKGGSYRTDGSCAFYYYMSTDDLPVGWRLLTADQP